MPFSVADGLENFGRSFDFSKFPDLQEVNFTFTVGWKEIGLPWIPMALSTLRPATSPRLSAIRLNFTGSPTVRKTIEALIKDTGGDLRRTADEMSRIEREFEGAVNLTVSRDSVFKAVLDKLNVGFRFIGWRGPRNHVDSFSFAPCSSSSIMAIDS